MKLFQRLLVAPAALGLMAPVAANADVAFSPTTTLNGSAFFTTGSVADGGTADTQEELYMQYAYGLDLNSSFGPGNTLSVGIEAGNASGPLAEMDSAITGGNNLTVASMFYTFPVGDLTVTTGPLVDQDDVLAATTSAYSGSFRLSAMPFSEAGDETGAGIAIAYAADNGFVLSGSFIADEGQDPTKGINADNADDITTLSFGYNGEGFGGGIVIASNDGDGGTTGYDTFGAGIYYTPDSVPATISVAYDTKDPESGDDSSDIFIGVDYEVGPGILSAAYNSKDVDNSSILDQTGFEVSYSYSVNDHVTITPGFFTVEETTANKDDDTCVVLETAFSF